MANKEFQIICAIEDVTATGDVIKFRVPFSGVLKQIDLWTNEANANGDNVFNLNIDGDDLFSSGDRPKLAENETHGQLVDLEEEVTFGDEVILQLEEMAIGGVKSDLVLQLTIDDGVSAGSGGAVGILAPPKTSNSDDDEFEGNSLNTSIWTKTGGATQESYNDKIQSAYHFQLNPTETLSLWRSYTNAGNFSVTLCFSIGLTSTNNSGIDFTINDNNGSADGSNLVQMQYLYDTGAKIRTNKRDAGSYTYNIGVSSIASPDFVDSAFLHFQRSGSNWLCYFSYNGVRWTLLSTISLSMTVASIRIIGFTDASNKTSGAFHWIRFNWITL